MPSPVAFTLQANAGPRFLSGFLTRFLAFLLREQAAPGWRPELLLGLGAGMSQSLAKLSLDSTIQQYVPERVQTSAFARGDPVLQLAWVVGGFAGIALPLVPSLGLGVTGAVLAGWLCLLPVPRRVREVAPVGAAGAPGRAAGRFDPPVATE